MRFFVEDELVDTDHFTPFTVVQVPCGCEEDCHARATVLPSMLQVNTDGEVYFFGQVIDCECDDADIDYELDEYPYPYPEDN